MLNSVNLRLANHKIRQSEKCICMRMRVIMHTSAMYVCMYIDELTILVFVYIGPSFFFLCFLVHIRSLRMYRRLFSFFKCTKNGKWRLRKCLISYTYGILFVSRLQNIVLNSNEVTKLVGCVWWARIISRTYRIKYKMN